MEFGRLSIFRELHQYWSISTNEYKHNKTKYYCIILLLYTRNVENSPRADMHTGLKMLVHDVPYLTLLMQRLGQLTTKVFITTVSPLFILFQTL